MLPVFRPRGGLEAIQRIWYAEWKEEHESSAEPHANRQALMRRPQHPSRRQLGASGECQPMPDPPSPLPATPEPLRGDAQIVVAYHDRTKHYQGRYAQALGYMDWDTQPDPFRTFTGADRVSLALRDPEDGPRFETAMLEGNLTSAPLDHASVSQLFQDALGLSAWKEGGRGEERVRWSLRVNPSSGNLHPTEGYLVSGPVDGLSDTPAVWHYQAHDHCLERRALLPDAWWKVVADQLPPGAILVGLSSIYLRESWKYGERAFRYCQHDTGHALATIAIAAAGLGWTARVLESLTDPEIARVLGVTDQEGPEAEQPDLLMAVFPQGAVLSHEAWAGFRLPSLADEPLAWTGAAAPLADDHHPWPVIDEVHAATWRSSTPAAEYWRPALGPNPSLVVGESALMLRRMVHQRRSAVEMNGRTGILLEDFVQALARTIPGRRQVPFTCLPWRPHIHLLVFVHRVETLAPGIYILVRDPTALDTVRASVAPDAPWTRPDCCPEDLPLYLLSEGICRSVAAGVSCGQAIAADGAFAVAMLGEFRGALDAWGAWFYKRLHWEAGLIGQLLYLEAEAIGVGATGIGCFFDDPTHNLVGMKGHAIQDIYHFTVGGAVEDDRLATLPAYGHIGTEQK